MATTRDPQFLAEIKKSQSEFDPAPGEYLEDLAKKIAATPPDVIAAHGGGAAGEVAARASARAYFFFFFPSRRRKRSAGIPGTAWFCVPDCAGTNGTWPPPLTQLGTG